MLFNRNPFTVGKSVEDPSTDEIKSTPSLWNASFDDAIRFGGDLTRRTLATVDLAGDRKYVTVDTKIHMLMPGMLPAIPGWHTDGVPRQQDGSPFGGPPLLGRQEELDVEGKAPRYHLLVSGDFCSTEFLVGQFDLQEDATHPAADLYKEMTQAVERILAVPDVGGRPVQDYISWPTVFTAPPSTWVNWDWWNIHRGVQSKGTGWRFLIRVTESDFLPPKTDPREFIRTQNQVYVPLEYGW